jgi:hypothetical protein
VSVDAALNETATTSSSINLGWNASTDADGIGQYEILRCQGAGCTPTVQVGTSKTKSFLDTGLASSTTYVYAVVAVDNNGNASGPSAPASATTPSGGATITIGETTILPIDDYGNANLLLAQPATLTVGATLETLSFYVTQSAGKLRLGLYDATGPSGGPGAKLAETAEITTPAVGWTTVAVVAPVSLRPGTYWLAYFPSDNNLHFRRDGSGSAVFYSLAYGPLPATFSTSTTPAGDHWSFYATALQ